MIIGVAGGSGSGKTTFARRLQSYIGPMKCSIISQDSYYFDRSQDFKGDGSVNFDHPQSIDWTLMSEHLALLKNNEPVNVPKYDFATHSRLSETHIVVPKPLIVVDGILIFYPDEVRELIDFKVFIDTQESVRFQRRLHRDVVERGRTEEGVRKQYEATVKPMHDLFVEPTRLLADHIVSGEADFQPEIDRITKTLLGLHTQAIY